MNHLCPTQASVPYGEAIAVTASIDRFTGFALSNHTGMQGLPQSHIQDAAFPRNANVGLKPGRRSIPQETWDQWKADVYNRYIRHDDKLEDVMKHYRHQYNFHGT